MGLILKILGVLFLVVIGLVVAALLFLRYKIRSIARRLAAQMEAQMATGTDSHIVTEIHFEPKSDLDPEEKAAIGDTADEFLALGFRDAGVWTVREISGMVTHGFVHPDDSLIGCIQYHPSRGMWGEILGYFEDGTNCSVSNFPGGTALDPRPTTTKVDLPRTASVADLVAAFRKEQGSRRLKRVQLDEFTQVLAEDFVEEQTWRSSRGGPTLEEIRRIAMRDQMDATEEDLKAAYDSGSTQHREQFEAEVRDRFLEQTAGTADDDSLEKDRLIVIHDGLEPDTVKERFLDWLEEGETLPAVEIAPDSARSLFAAWNRQLAASRRYRLLGTVDGIVPADIYVAAL